MRLKYFLPASSLLISALLSSAYAQTPAKTPKLGYLRFWNMLPASSGAFDLCKAGAPGEAPLITGHAYQYGSYRDFPAGIYHLVVYRKGDRGAPLRTIDLDLKPDTFFTVLVSPQGTTGKIEIVDDTNDPQIGSGKLTIRNYFGGATVEVSTDKGKIADAVSYGQVYTAGGFPLARLPLTLRTKLPNGTIAESTAEADFVDSKRATVLVIPDSYGRFRPRVTIDGKNL